MARNKNHSAVVRVESAEDLRYGIDENGRLAYEVFDDRVDQYPPAPRNVSGRRSVNSVHTMSQNGICQRF